MQMQCKCNVIPQNPNISGNPQMQTYRDTSDWVTAVSSKHGKSTRKAWKFLESIGIRNKNKGIPTAYSEDLNRTIKLDDIFQSLADEVIEDYPSNVKVKKLSVDLEQLDLKNITYKLNSMRRSTNMTDAHEIVLRELETRRLGTQGSYYERRDAREYLTKTKIIDLMLQLIYMTRHKVKQLESDPYYNSKDTSYRIAFLYRKIRRIWKRMHDIYTLMVLNQNEKYKHKRKFVKINTFLNLHIKVAKLHVDFLYPWWVLVKMHEKYHWRKLVPNTYPPPD